MGEIQALRVFRKNYRPRQSWFNPFHPEKWFCDVPMILSQRVWRGSVRIYYANLASDDISQG